MRIYDISVPIDNTLVTWPGDPGVSVERTLDIAKGDPATVTFLKMGSHTGTHVDACSHFKANAQTLDEMDLSIYVGKARVIEIKNEKAITAEELSSYDWTQTERVLFKTANSATPWPQQKFDEHFCHITPQAAEFLVDQGIRLVGIDYLSVESFHATTLYDEEAPTHHRLIDAGIYIVEGLQLADISAGWYELICLPLKIRGGDGAPARVILRDLPKE
jgi:arylformamidase